MSILLLWITWPYRTEPLESMTKLNEKEYTYLIVWRLSTKIHQFGYLGTIPMKKYLCWKCCDLIGRWNPTLSSYWLERPSSRPLCQCTTSCHLCFPLYFVVCLKIWIQQLECAIPPLLVCHKKSGSLCISQPCSIGFFQCVLHYFWPPNFDISWTLLDFLIFFGFIRRGPER